jgi:hypothetical protein
MRVRAPAATAGNQAAPKVMALVMGLVLAAGLIVWAARLRSLPTAMTFMSNSDRLVAEVAALDARFEREGSANAATRASYEQKRAGLKQQLADALAAPSAQS